MAQHIINPFNQRQVMQREDFEIFHYNNSATFSCPPHQHDFFELFYLLDDSLDYIVEGLRYSMTAGSVMLIAPGQIHRADVYGSMRNIDRFVLWISMDYVKKLTESLPHIRFTLLGSMEGRNLIRLDSETSQLIRQLLFALHRETAGDAIDSAQLHRFIISQLLIYCGRCIVQAPSTLTPKAALRYREIIQVYEYIVTHLKENMSIPDLADRFFMDRNTLMRHFRHEVGMTPGECIRWHRLESARLMLLDGASAQEACAESGFSDYSAFYRAFKQAYDMSPRDYVSSHTNSRGLSRSAQGDEGGII